MWKDIDQQPQVALMLQGMIQQQRIAHAYIFTGPRGVGKRQVALQMAKALFCAHRVDGDSCDQCSECIRVDHGNHPDVHMVEPDGLSIKIAQIRELRKEFSLRAVEAGRKLYILLGAETMTREAANSLLKFLEEPSGNVTAILICENQNSLLPTILSRCQIFYFQELPWQKVVQEAVQQGVAEGDARVAAQIVKNAEAVQALCQTEVFASIRKLVIKFYQEFLTKKRIAFVKIEELLLQDSVLKDEVELFLDLSIIYFRDLLQVSMGRIDEVANYDSIEGLKEEAARSSMVEISKKLEILLQTRSKLKTMNHQLAMEQMVLELAN